MSDVYKIGVQLALTGNMSAALAGIASQLIDIDNKTTSLMSKWEKLGTNLKLAVGGAVATGAGVGLLDGLGKLIDRGNDLVHVQQQLMGATQNQAQVAEATAVAWEKSAKYGLSVSSVLSDIKEARTVFGSTEHAIDFIDPLEKMRVVLNGMTEGSGNKAVEAVYNMARAGELKGLTSPDEFIRYFDGMTRAITASGGKVDPHAFMQATQYGKLASKGWSEEFYTKILPSMIQEAGPSTAGTQLMSLYGTVNQGRVTQRALELWEKLGLIEDPSKLIFDKQGNTKGFQPGAVQGTELFTRNPFEWAQTVLKPAIEKSLGHEIKPGDTEAINLLGGMFGNRNSAAAIAALLLEGQRIRKDAAITGQAKGLDAVDDLLGKDPKIAAANFKSAWDNLLTSLGSPLVQPAISAMNAMAGVMKSLTAVAAAHPDAVKALGVGAAGAGGALAIGGTAAMSAAIWRTLFGSGGLNASAAALNTSAVMLQQAAVALGAKGVPGVGGVAGAPSAGKPWGSALGALLAYFGVEYADGKMGQLMNWLPHARTDYYGKSYDPEAEHSKGLGGRVERLINDLPDKIAGDTPWYRRAFSDPKFWFNRDAMRSGMQNMGGAVAPPPPPPVNVNQQTQVKVQIGNQSIDAYIMSVVTKAMAGFATSTPAQNTGSTMPAVDGGH
ncbi:hypothetical protein [Labrys sp. ZIDIC5]|uniref:hypothetical protein n=1 Tax=Labrys sedimenti TaxID=3106036 RepID=UPI002ACAA9E1|nr:hypothetical protein [Labrys sp. ZIDIC5]MDZ5448959.1 hypothetical protein [Labrys sp. ZIDIC5]